MRIYKSGTRIIVEHGDLYYENNQLNWDEFINRRELFTWLQNEIKTWKKTDLTPHDYLSAPIGQQEVWAAGVTYQRSKVARKKESKSTGGGTFYDRVYDAARPEIFFKATARSTSGPGAQVNIRRDSAWNVPEPELTLFISSSGSIEGYTIGNDMSSRSIEGENPLYLPQAKVYDKSAGLGPCILVKDQAISDTARISMEIQRNHQRVFLGTTSIDQIKRSFHELVEYLYRELTFPHGCFLMTGTGIVPPDEFTLEVGDVVNIEIEGIGTLSNILGTKN